MDKRSWPWKKKSSEKQVAEKSLAIVSGIPNAPPNVAETQADQAKQDNSKKAKHVQISMESYTHLTGLENQVKSYEERVMTLEDEIKELNEKLSEANSEITNKENLVKQHAKVAEEAVSGWEKAEAEASALKNHLESVTLLKLTAEDRSSHLDGALKECMRQIRNLKEEHEQKLHEVILNKTKQFDKMKLDLEAKIGNLDQRLLRSAAENAELLRSLQERSNMLIKLSEEKTKAEAEIEHLRNNIDSCEKEINSLNYELHIVSKEIEIRNEEKNMSVRSADAANKQHLEGVKKIAKLEAECQRLRGLVRKKLPGPAALAQMKHEVENLSRDYGESHLRRFPVKSPSPHLSQLTEYDNSQKYQKENELLAERLLAMEEETKILKEALSHRNSELQASRSICSKTASKLQSIEVQMQANSEHKTPPKSNIQLAIGSLYSRSGNDSPSLISRAGDGNDDDVSCSGSCSTPVTSEFSNFKMQKYVDSLKKSETASHLDLMDDFLEMEKLAFLSNNSNEAVSRADTSGNISNARAGIENHDTSVEVTTSPDAQSSKHHNSKAQKHPKEEVSASSPKLQVDHPIFLKLQSKISVLKSMSLEKDMEGALEEICCVVQDFMDTLHHKSVNCLVEGTHCPVTSNDHQPCAEYPAIPVEREMILSGEGKPRTKAAHTINQELEAAISQIYDFVMILGKEAKAVVETSPDGVVLKQKLDIFSAKYNDIIRSGTNLMDFILDLSKVLNKACVLNFNVLGFRSFQVENGNYDCIDKIVSPENKGVVDSSGEVYPNGCAHFSDNTSDPDSNVGNLVPTSESTVPLWKCSLEEFEQLKLEKDNMAIDLATCTENWESTKSQLLETEHLLAEVKSQLTLAQKSNSLAETQLKCMAESYKSLETRAEEIQTEVNLLHSKIESLDNELQEERRSHQDALTKCRDLQEQLQRTESAADDIDAKTNQEKELAAAAEKLAQCQETIFLLGKRLKALRPQIDSIGSPYSRISQKSEAATEQEPIISCLNMQYIDPAETNAASSIYLQRARSDSPPDLYSAPFSPSDSEAHSFLGSPISSKHTKHRSNESGSSSASSTPTPEKHSRGFSRFFSSKGKNGL